MMRLYSPLQNGGIATAVACFATLPPENPYPLVYNPTVQHQ